MKFDHPDAECIARVIDAHRGRELMLHFNYATEYTQPWNDNRKKQKYGYGVNYGDYGALTIAL